jgi:mutator protein MutT
MKKVREISLIIFFDKEKRILLQDRKAIAKNGEEWGFFGGGIEPGETREQAVVRETKEELSIELFDHKYIGTVQIDFPDEGVYVEGNIFIAPLKDRMSQMDQKEGEGMSMYSIAEARKLKIVSGDLKVLDLLESYFNRETK